YICHDAYTREHFRMELKSDRTWWRRLLAIIQLLKADTCSRVAMMCSELTVFLSDHDQAQCGAIARKSIALLPLADGDVNLDEATRTAKLARRAHDNTVLFIGSPNYEPNSFGIVWLVERLAPHLHRLDPTIRIVLVGARAADYIPSTATNVHAAG